MKKSKRELNPKFVKKLTDLVNRVGEYDHEIVAASLTVLATVTGHEIIKRKNRVNS